MNENNDPINEIRRIRNQISEEFGHNPKQYVDYLKKIKGNYTTQTDLYDKIFNKNIQLTALTRELN